MKDLLSSIDRTKSSKLRKSREQELVEKLRQLKKLPLKDVRKSFKIYTLVLNLRYVTSRFYTRRDA